MSPGQKDGQHRSGQQCPFHRTFHEEQPQDEEEEHERPDIDRPARPRLCTEILREGIVELGYHRLYLRIGLFHRRLALAQRNTRPAFRIGYKQCQRLVDAVAPLCDVVTVEPGTGLVGLVRLHQFALAAHALLLVLPGVVEVGEFDGNTDDSCRRQHACRLQECGQLFLTDGFHEVGDNHEEDDEQIVIGHLHMVGFYFEGCEDRRHDEAGQVLAAVGQHDAGDHRREVGQCHYLPQVSGGDDDQKIGREGPHHTAQCRQRLPEVESPQQDVEAQKVGKKEPYIVRQPEVIGVHHLRQAVCRLIGRRHLVGRHTAEDGVCPACRLTCTVLVLCHFLCRSDTCRGIVAIENLALRDGYEEVSERDNRKQHDGHHIGKKSFPSFHAYSALLLSDRYQCVQSYKKQRTYSLRLMTFSYVPAEISTPS